jgi:hypothetical protein
MGAGPTLLWLEDAELRKMVRVLIGETVQRVSHLHKCSEKHIEDV